jgi:hypothetical protein
MPNITEARKLMDKSALSVLDETMEMLIRREIETKIWKEGLIKRIDESNKSKFGKTTLIIGGLLATYAIVSNIVKSIRDTKTSAQKKVLPFNTIPLGTYNKDIDTRLKFVTAIVALQLKDLYASDEDISWEMMQTNLKQCLVLEEDENKIETRDTFTGDFSEEDNVKSWLYGFLNKHDSDVHDAARIHDAEITEVIDFIVNKSVELDTFLDYFSASETNSFDLIDIGMIRFPTENNPYVKLYRLQLSGTFVGSKYMMIFDEKERAFTVSVNSRKYYPRDELLQRFSQETIQNVLMKFENMLISN